LRPPLGIYLHFADQDFQIFLRNYTSIPIMAPKTTDARFARLQTDPRFRRPNKKTTTVEIDDRFKDVLESEEFGGKGKGKGKASEGGKLECPVVKRFKLTYSSS
jgi:hypothetical protein